MVARYFAIQSFRLQCHTSRTGTVSSDKSTYGNRYANCRDDINAVIPTLEIDWFALAIAARHKRFGEQRPDDFKERAKQQRFLYYRGFTHEQINESFNTI